VHLSIRKALAATAVAATLAAGLGAAGPAAALASAGPRISNATTVCGDLCFDLSSELLGTSMIENAHKGGPDLNLRRAGDARTNEDFVAGLIGDLGDYCPNDGDHGTGLSADSYVCVTYPASWDVFEANFAPDSNETGLCAGVAVRSVPQPLTLQPCGASTRTLFVGDAANGSGGACGALGVYCPWISASDRYLSHPLALAVDTGSHHPANQLVLRREDTSGGVVPDYQQFTIEDGPAV
jgi:hypothetical protein